MTCGISSNCLRWAVGSALESNTSPDCFALYRQLKEQSCRLDKILFNFGHYVECASGRVYTP